MSPGVNCAWFCPCYMPLRHAPLCLPTVKGFFFIEIRVVYVFFYTWLFCFNVQQRTAENVLPDQRYQLLDSQMDRWCTALLIGRKSSCTSFPSRHKQSYICQCARENPLLLSGSKNLSKRSVGNYLIYCTYFISCATYVHVHVPCSRLRKFWYSYSSWMGC